MSLMKQVSGDIPEVFLAFFPDGKIVSRMRVFYFHNVLIKMKIETLNG